MATQQLPLSQQVLAQFSHAQSGEGGALLRRRMGSISTRRSSQSGDLHQPRAPPQLLLEGPDTGAWPPGASRQNSVFSNPNSPFVRREPLPLGKRLSFAAWAPGGQISFSGLSLLQPTRELRLENTYRTGPDASGRFAADRVRQVLQRTLDGYLGDARYSASTGAQLSRSLSDLVRGKARDVTPPRYKLVCLVVLGQPGNRGLQAASRCLWDTEKDDSAVAVFRNPSLFAVAMVHGVYCE